MELAGKWIEAGRSGDPDATSSGRRDTDDPGPHDVKVAAREGAGPGGREGGARRSEAATAVVVHVVGFAR